MSQDRTEGTGRAGPQSPEEAKDWIETDDGWLKLTPLLRGMVGKAIKNMGNWAWVEMRNRPKPSEPFDYDDLELDTYVEEALEGMFVQNPSAEVKKLMDLNNGYPQWRDEAIKEYPRGCLNGIVRQGARQWWEGHGWDVLNEYEEKDGRHSED
ncbi:MAG: hypothetical protein ACODAD_10840 [Planctomycetota bacterium]